MNPDVLNQFSLSAVLLLMGGSLCWGAIGLFANSIASLLITGAIGAAIFVLGAYSGWDATKDFFGWR